MRGSDDVDITAPSRLCTAQGAFHTGPRMRMSAEGAFGSLIRRWSKRKLNV